MIFRLVLIFILSTVFASPALAEEPSAESGQGGHDGGAHHRPHRHHIIVFLGTTRAHGENEDTIGVEYQYRVQEKVGFGGLVDHVGGDFDATAVAAAVYLHPVGDLEFIIAAGFENEDGVNESLVRTGVSYHFKFGKTSVAPTFNIDFVGEEEHKVYGVNVGWAF